MTIPNAMMSMEFHFRLIDKEKYEVVFTKEIPRGLMLKIAEMTMPKNTNLEQAENNSSKVIVIPKEQFSLFQSNIDKNVVSVQEKVRARFSDLSKIVLVSSKISEITLERRENKNYFLMIRAGGIHGSR
jgi:hypothetical protein